MSKRATAKKTTTRKKTVKKDASKKRPAKRGVAKKTSAKKTPVKKAPTKKITAKKSPRKGAVAHKSGPRTLREARFIDKIPGTVARTVTETDGSQTVYVWDQHGQEIRQDLYRG